MKNLLKTKNTDIVDAEGCKVNLRGVNLGGWLLMEAYIMHSPHKAEHLFKTEFRQALGEESLKDFEASFRSNFIKEKDIKNISDLGFNCIRVPFNYRIIEDEPFSHNNEAINYLDNVIDWSEKYKLWVILDMHAAPGCQNHDWHSDSDGRAELWNSKDHQERICKIWEFLADRYKDREYVAGYDVMNEAVTKDTKLLNAVYKKIIKAIRKYDKRHIVFLEANNWATDLACLDVFDDDNYALSVHFYEPIDCTFNINTSLSFPDHLGGLVWDKEVITKHFGKYKSISEKHNAPILVGEFGVNARNGAAGEDVWLDFVLKCFNDIDFHWTYWTYKSVKKDSFPDGVYSYCEDPVWVNRNGSKTGWETFSSCWDEHKEAMIESWDTDKFKVNEKILKVLRQYAK